jgi:hypothetical protein
MRNLFFIFSFVLFANFTFAQVSPCGSGCNAVGVTVLNDHHCGDKSDYTFLIKNTSRTSLDICVYTQKINGGWSMDRIFEDVPYFSSNQHPSCRITGQYMIYYRPANSRESFPVPNSWGF